MKVPVHRIYSLLELCLAYVSNGNKQYRIGLQIATNEACKAYLFCATRHVWAGQCLRHVLCDTQANSE
jgi:hypothetical protein